MASITLHGDPVRTVGTLPSPGGPAPDFTLTGADLKDKSRADFAGKRLIFNIFPSLDTSTCAASVRRFNTEAMSLGDDVVVLCVSRDLPFAQIRFCGSEGLKRVVTLSSMRDGSFGDDWGVRILDGPLAGLFSRAVVVVDGNGTVLHSQQVSEIGDEPDYKAALAKI